MEQFVQSCFYHLGNIAKVTPTLLFPPASATGTIHLSQSKINPPPTVSSDRCSSAPNPVQKQGPITLVPVPTVFQ